MTKIHKISFLSTLLLLSLFTLGFSADAAAVCDDDHFGEAACINGVRCICDPGNPTPWQPMPCPSGDECFSPSEGPAECRRKGTSPPPSSPPPSSPPPSSPPPSSPPPSSPPPSSPPPSSPPPSSPPPSSPPPSSSPVRGGTCTDGEKGQSFCIQNGFRVRCMKGKWEDFECPEGTKCVQKPNKRAECEEDSAPTTPTEGGKCDKNKPGDTYCPSLNSRLKCNEKFVWENSPCPAGSSCVRISETQTECQSQNPPPSSPPPSTPPPSSGPCNEKTAEKLFCVEGERFKCSLFSGRYTLVRNPCTNGVKCVIEPRTGFGDCAALADPLGCYEKNLEKYRCFGKDRYRCQVSGGKYVYQVDPCPTNGCLTDPNTGFAQCPSPPPPPPSAGGPKWACNEEMQGRLCCGERGTRFFCDEGVWYPRNCSEGKCIQRSKDSEPVCQTRN